MNKTKAPIFCDNDPEYALAELNGKPFCVDCIVKAVQKNFNPNWVEKIRPLDASGPFAKTSVSLTCLE